MADQFDEFIQEVQQDIQQEKYLKLWQKYGKHITMGASVILAAAAAYVIWTNYQQKRTENISNGFFTAQKYNAQEKHQEALAVLDSLSISDKETYGYMNHFQKAASLLKMAEKEHDVEQIKKIHEEALSLYDAAAKTAGLPIHIKEYGAFMYARTLWMLKQKPSKDILDILHPLMEEKKPWHILAKELAAMIHYHENRFKESLELFADIIKNERTPQGLRMRARMMAQLAKQKLSFDVKA